MLTGAAALLIRAPRRVARAFGSSGTRREVAMLIAIFVARHEVVH